MVFAFDNSVIVFVFHIVCLTILCGVCVSHSVCDYSVFVFHTVFDNSVSVFHTVFVTILCGGSA